MTEMTLADVRQFISSLSSTLDPASRYVAELLAIVDASKDLADLERRMTAGCRGARHAGAEVFARMTLEQKLRCNLITNETVLFRFSEGEWDVLQRRLIPRFAAAGGKILCAPCSHGEEAFSVAAACLQAGVGFEIDAVDIQSECIAEAKTGRLTMGFPAIYLESPAVVGAEVRRRIHFDVADLTKKPGEPGAIPAKKWTSSSAATSSDISGSRSRSASRAHSPSESRRAARSSSTLSVWGSSLRSSLRSAIASSHATAAIRSSRPDKVFADGADRRKKTPTSFPSKKKTTRRSAIRAASIRSATPI